MTLTPKQIAALNAPLDTERIAQRKQANITLDYLEGYDVIDKANEIFGYDGWCYHVTAMTDVTPEGGRPIFEARVWVKVDGYCYREDVGHGIAAGTSSEAIETARKGAVTDALKRALRSFGNQFGNSLYDKDHDRGEGGRPANLRQAGGPTATPPPPRPASPPRPAPPMQPTAPLRASADDILDIARLMHQVDEGIAEEFCQDYDIPIETRADGRHYKKGLTEASLREVNELTRDAADILKHLLLPHVKKMAKGIPEQGITQVSSSALPLPEDIKTVGDLFTAAFRHFRLQRGEIFAILGVEKAEQIHDFGAAWKIVVAAKKQGALV